jgi:hypothetical protein
MRARVRPQEQGEGEAFLGDRGEHQLSLLPRPLHRERCRVDHLGDEVVLVHVQAASGRAFEGDAGAEHLGEPVVVHGRDAQARLQLLAQRLAPRLGTEEAHAQREAAGRDAALGEGTGEGQRVARRAGEGRGLEIAHDHQLALQRPGGGRHHRGADALGTVVEAEPAAEEAVGEGDLHHVVLSHLTGGEHPGHALGPGPNVVGRVADDHRLAGGARRALDAHDVAQRHRKHVVGVGSPQVGLGGEGHVREVRERLHVLDLHSRALEGLPVECNVAARPVQRGLQAFDLHLREIPASHGLEFSVPDHRIRLYRSSIRRYSLPRYARCTSRLAESSAAVPSSTTCPVSIT